MCVLPRLLGATHSLWIWHVDRLADTTGLTRCSLYAVDMSFSPILDTINSWQRRLIKEQQVSQHGSRVWMDAG